MRISTIAVLIVSLIFSNSASSQIQTTIASLRTITAVTNQNYFITDAGRQGLFYYDAADVTTADNGGTVIVNQGSKRFKRVYEGAIDVRWFGAKADYIGGTSGTDNAAAINAAMAAAKKLETVVIPTGQYRVFSNIALPDTRVKKVKMEVYGDIFFSKGFGFIIEGEFQEFRSYGLICGMNAGGVDEATYSTYVGVGVLIKNGVNCYVEVNEVKDFKYGIHQLGIGVSGNAVGNQYNQVRFNMMHHNYIQLKISTQGTYTWNNACFFYGGQLGRGPALTYGKGGTYGLVIMFDGGTGVPGSITGHMFYNMCFEGTQYGMKLQNTEYNTFTNIRVEHNTTLVPFDLDATATSTKFSGVAYIIENWFAPGKVGTNTIINGTPLWGGPDATRAHMGHEAITSITPGKFLVTTDRYNYTNFMVNKVNDLISQTGQYPTVQAMLYRINGVMRSVPYKKTFFHVKAATAGSPLTLPPNIGLVRVEANQAKVFKIDTGDLAIYGEEFLVEYLSPQYPISFVHGKTGAVLIPATQFPSGGTYRCLFTDNMFYVSKIGAEYKTVTQDGPNWAIATGTETHYVNYQWGTAIATLPPANQWPGRVITIKNLQAGKTVQVAGVNASDESIIQGRGAMTVKSDSTNWNIIGMYRRNLTY
jgi:hypothetical protein